MRYDNDGVRVGLLGLESHRNRSHLPTIGSTQLPASGHHRDQWWRRRLLRGGYHLIGKDAVACQRTNDTSSGQTARSLKVLFHDYVHGLTWFCTRLNEFLFMFVFHLLYER